MEKHRLYEKMIQLKKEYLWEVYYYNNKKLLLGTVIFDKKWKKYVWHQSEDAQMTIKCLRDLADVMSRLKSK